MTYIIFLRGVNVGGNAVIKMDALKSALGENNYKEVKTYINSGNLVIRTGEAREKLKEKIKRIIRARFGLPVEMIIKTEKELKDIIKKDPFDSEKEADNSKRMVVLLSGKIAGDGKSLLNADKKIEEHFYLKDDLLFIYYYNGMGRSKFTTNFIEKRLHVTATARNWNTMLKMVEL